MVWRVKAYTRYKATRKTKYAPANHLQSRVPGSVPFLKHPWNESAKVCSMYDGKGRQLSSF